LDQCADWLEKEINSTRNSDAIKMIDVVQRLPVGWSLTEAQDGWIIYDEDDEVICKARTPTELHRILNIEFQIAQTFVGMMHAMKNIKPAEA